ncbi:MAG TPA: hypothetical protein DEV98_05390 [Clostridiales bacterium]|nr:hypothetical protein [Clostridiales bacterium]
MEKPSSLPPFKNKQGASVPGKPRKERLHPHTTVCKPNTADILTDASAKRRRKSMPQTCSCALICQIPEWRLPGFEPDFLFICSVYNDSNRIRCRL